MEARSPKSKLHALVPLLRVDPEGSGSLQAQLRSRIVTAISSGILSAGTKMPSSRALATSLGVSRNTVILAYQNLIAEGQLVGRERSGVFVASRKLPSLRPLVSAVGHGPARSAPAADRLVSDYREGDVLRSSPNWFRFPYPFLEGRFDRSLFPVAEWREASRMALGVSEVAAWSTDMGEADDEMLVDEVRRKLLPRRGISARRDEVLITSGEQQALHLISMLFAGPGRVAAVEDPGLPEMRALLSMRGAELRHLPVDDRGLVIDEKLRGVDLLHVSPSRQRPTGVTLPEERRRALLDRAAEEDMLIVEDDFECEMSYLSKPVPSLYSLDEDGRVLYVASLSKVLAPGLRLGFLVAPAEVIAAARRLRNLTTKRPSPNNQRTAAHFLALGHYDTMMTRLAEVYEGRLMALRDALNHYRPMSIAIPSVSGGTFYWVRGPEGLKTERLVEAAEAAGVLIEPAADYFADPEEGRNAFRLGVTSIPEDKIREGIEKLNRVMKALASESRREVSDTLAHDEIERLLAGKVLLYKTVYGEPCTIELCTDGTMRGRAGFANEEVDQGRWWIDGDEWVRQWSEWAYGEEARFRVRFQDGRVDWVGTDGRVVDGAVLVPTEGAELDPS